MQFKNTPIEAKNGIKHPLNTIKSIKKRNEKSYKIKVINRYDLASKKFRCWAVKTITLDPKLNEFLSQYKSLY